MEKIIIATIKSWNIENSKILKDKLKSSYEVHIIDNKEDLNTDIISSVNPKFIFFPHWSWIIPKEIYDNFECVVFHMTDLPFGRGGSPLQNLIINKVYDTKISAIKVDGGLDTGPIYMKKDFSANAYSLINKGVQFNYTNHQNKKSNLHIKNVTLPVFGKHQMENAACAITTSLAFDSSIKEKKIKQGLKKVQIPGRSEVFVMRGKAVILDGAHNPAGVESLKQALNMLQG